MSGAARLWRWAGLVAVVMLAAGGMVRAEDGWRELTQHRLAEAQDVFAAVVARAPGERAARLGAAVAALNRPPRTVATVQRASEALRVLVAEESADDVGLAARYVLARIAGLHEREVRPAAAEAGLQALVEEAPGHLIAEMAAVKLCLLVLYERELGAEPDFARAEALAEGLTRPAMRRDAHLAIGRAYLFYRRESERAYAHLRVAEALQPALEGTRVGVTMSVAELAFELGHDEEARVRYEQVRRENPRDDRGQLIRQRLEALERRREVGP